MMNDDTRLRELMSFAQSGNQKAYRELLHEISQLLRPFLYNRLSDRSHCEDVVQEILLSIHKARHTYESSRPFLPWMYAIATFRVQDHLRKLYRGKENEFVDFDAISEAIPAEDGVDHEKNDIITKSLSLLPKKQRTIVQMMHVDGYTAKEVAAKTGMSLSAVKVSAHRSYKKLAAAFAAQQTQVHK